MMYFYFWETCYSIFVIYLFIFEFGDWTFFFVHLCIMGISNDWCNIFLEDYLFFLFVVFPFTTSFYINPWSLSLYLPRNINHYINTSLLIGPFNFVTFNIMYPSWSSRIWNSTRLHLFNLESVWRLYFYLTVRWWNFPLYCHRTFHLLSVWYTELRWRSISLIEMYMFK